MMAPVFVVMLSIVPVPSKKIIDAELFNCEIFALSKVNDFPVVEASKDTICCPSPVIVPLKGIGVPSAN